VFSQELADIICKRLSEGESLRAICRDDGMPTEATIRNWAMIDYHGFFAQYARAREIGYAVMAEELLELSDKPNIGTKEVSKATGLEITTGDNVDRTRLQIDTRKWLLSKMLPKIYGDKQQIEHSGTLTLSDRMKRAEDKADGKP
jgi:hypothetical protein